MRRFKPILKDEIDALERAELCGRFITLAWRAVGGLPTVSEGYVPSPTGAPWNERSDDPFAVTAGNTPEALFGEVKWRDSVGRKHPFRVPPSPLTGPASLGPQPCEVVSRRPTRRFELRRRPEEPPKPPRSSRHTRTILDELGDLLLATLTRPTTEMEGRLLSLVERARTTEWERPVLERIRAHHGALPESVRVACARIFDERGEPDHAIALVGRGVNRSAATLQLESDLLASRNDLLGALSATDAALTKDIDVVGGRERLSHLQAMFDRVRSLVRPLPLGAELGREEGALAKIERLVTRGQRAAAILEAREVVRRGAHVDVLELLMGLEARLCGGPRITLLRGDGEEPWTLVDGEAAMIGRAGADVVVASPLVSREQLLVRRCADGVEILDMGSRNGNRVRGVELRGRAVVGAGLVVDLAGAIPCEIRPLDPDRRDGPVLILSPDTKTVLTFGQSVQLGPWTVEHMRDDSMPRWLVRAGATSFDLMSGDRFVDPASNDRIVIV